MQSKIRVLVTVLLVGTAVAAFLFFRANRFRLPVAVTFTISVTPSEQVDFVAGQARSAKIKYDAAKRAGTAPALAQRLSAEPVPNSATLELKVGTETKEEAQRFVDAFVELLKMRCEGTAQVALVGETIR